MLPDIKQDVINRLCSIEGHIRGIERMVADDHYCIDIMKQIKAVQSALDRVNSLIMANHLQTCVTGAIRSEDEKERERVIGEIVSLFDASIRLGR